MNLSVGSCVLSQCIFSCLEQYLNVLSQRFNSCLLRSGAEVSCSFFGNLSMMPSHNSALYVGAKTNKKTEKKLLGGAWVQQGNIVRKETRHSFMAARVCPHIKLPFIAIHHIRLLIASNVVEFAGQFSLLHQHPPVVAVLGFVTVIRIIDIEMFRVLHTRVGVLIRGWRRNIAQQWQTRFSAIIFI